MEMTIPTKNNRSWVKWLIAGIAVLAAGVAYLTLPVNEYLKQFLQWVEGLGIWGPVAVVAAYIVTTAVGAPGAILTLGSGAIFGVGKGFIVVSAGSTLGATAAFLVARYLMRGTIERKVGTHPRFRAIDQAVGRQGFKIVLLTRLSPVFPFNVLNFMYGLTNIKLGHYMLASWIGMMPGTLLYVWIGAAAGEITTQATGTAETDMAKNVLLVVGLIVTGIVTVYISKIASRAIKDATPGLNADSRDTKESIES